MNHTQFASLRATILAFVLMCGFQALAADAVKFTPPEESTIPDNDFGAMIRLGKNVFINTAQYAPDFSGNGLNCVNCHLDRGRKAASAPLWAAYVSYPAYRAKTKSVSTFEERLQGCFRYSMNGKPPPAGSKELTALVTYAYWLASGAPTGTKLAGAGYPNLAAPPQAPDYKRGAKVYAANCAICHGANGEGTKSGDRYAFPPLWGNDSFNWGAGMHRIDTAAAFVKANMPLGRGGSLSDQDAWDVAAFVDGHDRPQDPRFKGSLTETQAQYHQENCAYGKDVNGELLGTHSEPAGGRQRGH